MQVMRTFNRSWWMRKRANQTWTWRWGELGCNLFEIFMFLIALTWHYTHPVTSTTWWHRWPVPTISKIAPFHTSSSRNGACFYYTTKTKYTICRAPLSAHGLPGGNFRLWRSSARECEQYACLKLALRFFCKLHTPVSSRVHSNKFNFANSLTALTLN